MNEERPTPVLCQGNGVHIVESLTAPETILEIEYDGPKRKNKKKTCIKKCFSGQQLLVPLIIIGALIGAAVGYGIKMAQPSDTVVTLVTFPGELLMRMLKMLIVPIIATSMVIGVASLDMKKSGRMGIHATIYYILTTVSAAILGIVLVTTIQPGKRGQGQPLGDGNEAMNQKGFLTADSYLDIIRNVFPDNLIAACFEVAQTKVTAEPLAPDQVKFDSNFSSNLSDSLNDSASGSEMKYTKTLHMVRNTNVLGLISFSIAFGVALSSIGEEGRIVLSLFSACNTIFMKMINLVIWYSPIGISSLIAGHILKIENPETILQTLGMYLVTVIIGLIIHSVFVLSLLFWAITRRNPFTYALGMSQALLTALGTSTSVGTLPVTMRCLENNLGIDKRITRFILPIGATMNMDGTAVMEAVAAITIAQMYNMALGFGQIITISLTATVASIGAACVPSSGLVTLILVLTSIGIPVEPVAMLWSIDWFLDRLRTTVNVFGDSLGAGIVQHLDGHLLKETDQNE